MSNITSISFQKKHLEIIERTKKNNPSWELSKFVQEKLEELNDAL